MSTAASSRFRIFRGFNAWFLESQLARALRRIVCLWPPPEQTIDSLPMLFKQSILEGIAAGKVTLAFRRWKRIAVRKGGTLTTSVGVLRFGAVDEIALDKISSRDAKRAGFETVAALQKALGPDDERPVYRIAFKCVGEDPRIALRKDSDLDEATLAGLRRRLARYDAAASRSWTRESLKLIAKYPGVRAGDLAKRLGVDKDGFKINIRKLKGMGLTESLEIGYRLSPRGTDQRFRIESEGVRR